MNKIIEFKNPRTGDVWLCENYTNRRTVDGKDFIEVYKQGNRGRNHWIALDALVKVKTLDGVRK